MTRPINADAGKTRFAISQSALRAFGSLGRDGARVRDIAEEAGVTFASVHHYFGTKEALYEACLEEAFAELAETGRAIMEAVAAAKPRKAIDAGVRVAFRAALARPERSKFLLRAFIFETDPAIRKRLAKAQRVLLGQAQKAISPKLQTGVRIPLMALGVLIARFATADAAEVALLGEDVPDPEASLEDFLVRVAEQTLSLNAVSEST